MAMLEDRDRERAALLLAIYEAADGNTGTRVEPRDIYRRLGLDDSSGQFLLAYLVERGLAEYRSVAGDVEIAPAGVDEAERLLRGGSQVPFSVVVLSVEEHRAVEAFLGHYRAAMESGEIRLFGDDLAEAEAELATIDAQHRSPRPKRRIVRASIRTLGSLTTGAAGNAVWQGLVKLVSMI